MKVQIINFPSSNHVARLHILEHLLQKKGVTVEKTVCPLWGDNSKRIRMVKKPWIIIPEIFIYLRYLRSIIKSIKQDNFDKIIIGYPAYLDAFFISLFCKKHKSKIYIDFFLSIYDTVVLDRKMISGRSFFAKLLLFTEKRMLSNFINILVDTNTNAERYSNLFHIQQEKFKRIFVGSRLILDEFSVSRIETDSVNIKKVGWVGSFIPLHGIKTILDTALLLKDEMIDFHLVGDGQLFSWTKETCISNGLDNVVLHGKLSYEDSMKMIDSCDICLGIFGFSEKSKSVIPFKLFDYLHMNKLVITQVSPAINEILPNKNILLVDATPSVVAETIKSAMFLNAQKSSVDELVCQDIEKVIL